MTIRQSFLPQEVQQQTGALASAGQGAVGAVHNIDSIEPLAAHAVFPAFADHLDSHDERMPRPMSTGAPVATDIFAQIYERKARWATYVLFISMILNHHQ